MRLTHIGGPTVLLELAGWRIRFAFSMLMLADAAR